MTTNTERPMVKVKIGRLGKRALCWAVAQAERFVEDRHFSRDYTTWEHGGPLFDANALEIVRDDITWGVMARHGEGDAAKYRWGYHRDSKLRAFLLAYCQAAYGAEVEVPLDVLLADIEDAVRDSVRRNAGRSMVEVGRALHEELIKQFEALSIPPMPVKFVDIGDGQVDISFSMPLPLVLAQEQQP